jgi:RUN and FYVE domain-containing protein 1
MSNLKMSNLELERTLEEMGSKLGVSVVKMEDIKEVTKQLNEYKWEEDDQVSICKQCKSEFNVARRKHHCRRCGRIFCHDCSDNKMPLPSFSKPVRVCNPCYESMLQNCTK